MPAAALMLLAGCGGATTPSSTATAASSASSTAPGASSTGASGDAGSATPSAAGPCDLLKKAHAETAAGQPMKDTPTSQTVEGVNTCTYDSSDGAAHVTVLLGTGEALKNFRTQRGDAVSGIGDEALWYRYDHALFVRKGDRAIEVSVVHLAAPEADWQQIATTLASTILGRL